MERVAQVFTSFAAADDADDEFYANLSPAERVDLLLDLIAQYLESRGEATTRFERVCRVTELSRS